MNKKELVKVVSERIGMSQKDATEIVEEVFYAISEELANGGEVSISKFGKFLPVEVAEREARNPQDPEATVVVPAHKRVKFKAASALKEAVK